MSTHSFKSEIRPYLEGIREDLTEVLKQLVEFNYPSEVFALAFEVFTDRFSYQFPARVFFMDKHNNEFFTYISGRAVYPSPVEPSMLKISGLYPVEIEERYEEQNDEFDAWTAAFEEFVAIFVVAWRDAGGLNFARQATIACHDHPMELNLITGNWQSAYSGFDS